MKLETFFEKFELFADLPDAVVRMQELVLQLSASGRLITDGLERPVEEDMKLMGTIVELVMGQAPSGDQYNTDGRGTVFVKVGEFGPLYPRKQIWTTNPLKFAKTGDVLVCVVGATVGKLNLAIDCAIGRSIAAIRPSTALDTKFLYYSLIPYTLGLRLKSRGSAQGVIGKSELNAVSLWVPSLAIQKRIVAKVDELMALCDRLEAQQKEREQKKTALVRASLARFSEAPTPANLEFIFHNSYDISPADLRKTILTLAVKGKLVPQDPNDEPAKKTFPKLGVSAIETDENGLPSGWLLVPLGKLGESRGGGTPSKSRPDFWKGDLPWVSPKDMKVLHISDAQDHISEAAVKGSSVRLIPAGSILMVVRGMILARAFPVALTTREVTINQDMKALLPTESKTKEYLLVALCAFEPDVLTAVKHSSHGTCKLKTEFLQDFVIPIPPLAEQRRIVAKVDQLMTLVDALETQLAASRTTGQALLAALVAELTSAKETSATA
jgi:type I restriction enzyme S subunit